MKYMIYFLKLKGQNVLKIGKTTNLKKRITKLEKDWGKFEQTSLIYELDNDKLKDLDLNYSSIENTIHRNLKLSNLYLKDYKEKYKHRDGNTEFFIYQKQKIDEILINMNFKNIIHSEKKLKDLSLKENNNRFKIKHKKELIDKKKKFLLNLEKSQNEYNLDFEISYEPEQDIERKKYIYKNSFKPYLKKNDKNFYLLIEFIKNKIEILNYYFIKNENSKKYDLYLEINNGNNINDFCNLVNKISYLTFNLKNYGSGTYSFNEGFTFFNKNEILKLSFNYNNSYYLKKYIFKLFKIFKNRFIKLKLKQNKKKFNEFIKNNQILNRYNQKKIFNNYILSKKIFLLKYLYKNKEIEKEISFNDIFKLNYYSNEIEIILMNGKILNFIHEYYIEDLIENSNKYGFINENNESLNGYEMAQYIKKNNNIIDSRNFLCFSHMININKIQNELY